MATNEYILLHQPDKIGRIRQFVCQNIYFEDAEVSSECAIIPLCNYNTCDITRQELTNVQSCTLQLAPGVVTTCPVPG